MDEETRILLEKGRTIYRARYHDNDTAGEITEEEFILPLEHNEGKVTWYEGYRRFGEGNWIRTAVLLRETFQGDFMDPFWDMAWHAETGTFNLDDWKKWEMYS